MSVFYTRSNVSRRGIDCSHGGKTVQSDARDCDINAIMSRYKQTGILPLNVFRTNKGVYADVSEYGDYRDCLDKVTKAEQMFMSLDSKIRRRFDNDPYKFLAFCSDAKNVNELVDLGLAEVREAPESKKRSKGSAPGAGAPNSVSDGGAGEPA